MFEWLLEHRKICVYFKLLGLGEPETIDYLVSAPPANEGMSRAMVRDSSHSLLATELLVVPRALRFRPSSSCRNRLSRMGRAGGGWGDGPPADPTQCTHQKVSMKFTSWVKNERLLFGTPAFSFWPWGPAPLPSRAGGSSGGGSVPGSVQAPHYNRLIGTAMPNWTQGLPGCKNLCLWRPLFGR